MIATRFAYHAPPDLDSAVGLLAASAGEATEVIGGGTWVVPEMTHGIRRPLHVVDLGRAGLGGIRLDGDALVIGATATYRDLLDSADVVLRLPLLRTLALGITGGSQVWNRGTIGGSACYANPASDVPAALVALDATLRLHGPDGLREVAAGAFFLDAFRSDVRPGEVLAEIALTPVVRSGYYKFKLCESSWPIVTAAYVRRADGTERVVLGSVEAVPLSVPLDGTGDDDVVARVEAAVTQPWSDVLAAGDYRQSIAGVVARRAIAAADDEERGA